MSVSVGVSVCDGVGVGVAVCAEVEGRISAVGSMLRVQDNRRSKMINGEYFFIMNNSCSSIED